MHRRSVGEMPTLSGRPREILGPHPLTSGHPGAHGPTVCQYHGTKAGVKRVQHCRSLGRPLSMCASPADFRRSHRRLSGTGPRARSTVALLWSTGVTPCPDCPQALSMFDLGSSEACMHTCMQIYPTSHAEKLMPALHQHPYPKVE